MSIGESMGCFTENYQLSKSFWYMNERLSRRIAILEQRNAAGVLYYHRITLKLKIKF